MREQVPHTLWLRVMPLRRPLEPVASAQEARDVAEHEAGSALAEWLKTKNHNAQERFLFWAEQYREAEREFQRLMAQAKGEF